MVKENLIRVITRAKLAGFAELKAIQEISGPMFDRFVKECEAEEDKQGMEDQRKLFNQTISDIMVNKFLDFMEE